MKGVSIKLALAINSNALYSLFSMYEISISFVPFPSLKTLSFLHEEMKQTKKVMCNISKFKEKLCFGLHVLLLLILF